MQHRWRLDRHHRVGLFGWLALAVLLAILISLATAKSAHGAYNQVGQWGHPAPPENNEFINVGDVAAGPGGVYYVVDPAQRLVRKYDASGNFLTSWGGYGSGNGQFRWVYAIRVDAAGALYVADAENCRVQKFDPNGAFLGKFGTCGTGAGQFLRPVGLDIGPSGNIYVFDHDARRISKFDTAGNFISAWGSGGAGPGQFGTPRSLVVDSTEHVYAVDQNSLGSRVQRFDSAGTYLSEWAVPFGDLTIDATDMIHLTDPDNNRVNRYSTAGSLLGQWGTTGSGDGQLNGPFGIDVDPAGNIVIADTRNYRVQRFTTAGGFLAKWGTRYVFGPGELRGVGGIATDAAGNVYVVEGDRIEKFGPSGNFLLEWGSRGPGNGQFDGPTDIAVAPSGDVYVTEAYNHRVQRFDSSGNFLGKWGTFGSADGQFNSPFGIDVGPDGTVFVVDTYNFRVQKFTPTGTFVGKFSGGFQTPYGLAVSDGGIVYVADHSNARMAKFDSNGTFLGQWPMPYAFFVDVDADGYVYVTGNFSSLKKFDANGALVGEIAPQGNGAGQVNRPAGVAVNASGEVYVGDGDHDFAIGYGKYRVQRLREVAPYVRPKAATPLSAPLVPAYDTCTAPDRVHAAPLNYASCSHAPGAGLASDHLTVGTPDANGAAANAVGSVKYRALNGNPGTPADEADVALSVDVTDVRLQAGLGDYTGELRVEPTLRLTDAQNGSVTVPDVPLPVTVTCSTTSDPAVGSTCAAATTLDAVVPGVVPEGRRSIWGLGDVRVYDGGPDGDTATAAGDTLFMVQGIFVP